MTRRKATPSYTPGDNCPVCPASKLQQRPAAFANFRCEEPVAWCAHCLGAWALKAPGEKRASEGRAR